MKRLITLSWFVCVLALSSFVVLPGCNQGKKEHAHKTKEHKDHKDVGPHGGPMAEWGDEEYHVEFVVDADKKQVTMYLLDGTAEAAPKVDAAKTSMELSIVSAAEKPKVELKHNKDASGDKGIAFTGSHDLFAKPDGMKVNVSGKVDGKGPYSGDVSYKAAKKSASRLYLTPGGIYTEADIKANGNMTAQQKFKGMDWSGAHEENVKPGDKICPVTKSKALKECAWTVKNQSYEFCCPPCVDKFINWAHYEPARIKNASEYVFKDM